MLSHELRCHITGVASVILASPSFNPPRRLVIGLSCHLTGVASVIFALPSLSHFASPSKKIGIVSRHYASLSVGLLSLSLLFCCTDGFNVIVQLISN